MKFNFETFGIQYTNKCNFYCAHCAADSSFKASQENMGLEFTLSILSEIKKTGFKEIAITGGECLIFKDDIIRIIKKAASLDLRVKLVTNGFWVKDSHQLENTTKELAANGLNKLIFSIDKYHQQFVNFGTISAAIDYIKKNFPEMEIEIYTIKLGNSDTNQDDILHKIKKKFEDLRIFPQKLLPYGRAKKLPKEVFIYMDEPNLATPCDQVFSPFIDHERNLYYCSNGYLLKDHSPLFLKNIQTINGLKLQLSLLKESLLFKSLSTVGPIEIFGEPKPEKKFISICDLCLDNMGKPESYGIIADFSNQNSIAINEIYESVKDALSKKG